MSYKKWSRIIGFLLCISLTLCFESMVLQVNAAEKQGGRIINVVYDDSGSMVKTDDGKTIPRWSQAIKKRLKKFFGADNDKKNINDAEDDAVVTESVVPETSTKVDLGTEKKKEDDEKKDLPDEEEQHDKIKENQTELLLQ